MPHLDDAAPLEDLVAQLVGRAAKHLFPSLQRLQSHKRTAMDNHSNGMGQPSCSSHDHSSP